MSTAPAAGEDRRARVLVSAYACGPVDESEAGAGWGVVLAATEHHDVCLMTRRRFRPAIDDAIRATPGLGDRLTVIDLELGERLLARKRRGADVYWYYVLWQRAAARTARRLHAETPFDVVHHVTFASDWLPCGVRRLTDVPLVWGPVGGATYLPWRMARWIGARGLASELVRSVATRACRRLWADAAARQAAVVVAQNSDTARRFRRSRRVVVEPNAALEAGPPSVRVPGDGPRRAVFAARLLPWKGGEIAIRALADPRLAQWTLDIYGAGPERSRWGAIAASLGVADRVVFHGHVDRAVVLQAFATADVLVFPSLHDSAGWAVGEASAAGCPVVCFDHGGPPLLAGPKAHLAPLGRRAVRGLADAMLAAAVSPVVRYERWSRDRFTALVDDWYADARSATRGATKGRR